jgi:hypothetical protein
LGAYPPRGHGLSDIRMLLLRMCVTVIK